MKFLMSIILMCMVLTNCGIPKEVAVDPATVYRAKACIDTVAYLRHWTSVVTHCKLSVKIRQQDSLYKYYYYKHDLATAKKGN